MDLERYPLEDESLNGLLVRLAEECAELIQAITKVQRFGLHGRDPNGTEFTNNARDVLREMRDVEGVSEAVYLRMFNHDRDAEEADENDAAGCDAEFGLAVTEPAE